MRTPEIKDAESIANATGWPIALVILVNPDTGDMHGVSWGTDLNNKRNWRAGCELGGKLLNKALEALGAE